MCFIDASIEFGKRVVVIFKSRSFVYVIDLKFLESVNVKVRGFSVQNFFGRDSLIMSIIMKFEQL